jgi:hypothetical protein
MGDYVPIYGHMAGYGQIKCAQIWSSRTIAVVIQTRLARWNAKEIDLWRSPDRRTETSTWRPVRGAETAAICGFLS